MQSDLGQMTLLKHHCISNETHTALATSQYSQFINESLCCGEILQFTLEWF